jgi:hypothetical protein
MVTDLETLLPDLETLETLWKRLETLWKRLLFGDLGQLDTKGGQASLVLKPFSSHMTLFGFKTILDQSYIFFDQSCIFFGFKTILDSGNACLNLEMLTFWGGHLTSRGEGGDERTNLFL